MSYIHPYFPVYTYFSNHTLGVNWESAKVLDYGGSAGSFLKDPECKTPQANYSCVDVSATAIEAGKEEFPEAQWIVSNQFNYAYNPEGEKGFGIGVDGKFDVIISYSVMTHMFAEEQKKTVDELYTLLDSKGSLAFTFVSDLHIDYFLDKRKKLKPSIDTSGIKQEIENSSFATLVNEDELYAEVYSDKEVSYDLSQMERHLISFFKPEYLKEIWPEAHITLSENPLVQHCCVVKN